MNSKLEKYIAFHDQKIKKAKYKKKYNISQADKEILRKIILIARNNPNLFLSRKEEFNLIVNNILKRSRN